MKDDDPKCDKCGAVMTTAMMAVFCPLKAKCEFYPTEPDLQEFITGLYPTEPPSAQGASMQSNALDGRREG